MGPRPAGRPGRPGAGAELVYVSPLKALLDVEKNLRAPLRGIGADVRVGIRTGDTPQKERRDMTRHPPDILITTPESLYLMLTSQAREIFAGTEAVIVDEIHAVPRTKRGAHLAVTLERLEQQADGPVQRIGLSATQNPLEEVGRFMVGPKRTCQVIDAGVRKPLDLKIHVPVESMVEPEQSDSSSIRSPARRRPASRSGRRSTRRSSSWSSSTARRSCSSTPAAPPSASRSDFDELNAQDAEGPATEIARAHHGSLAREERLVIEDQLKAANWRCRRSVRSRQARRGPARGRYRPRLPLRGSSHTRPAGHRPRRAQRCERA